MALFSDFFPINGNTTVANSGEQFGSLAPFTILQTGNGGTDSVRVHTVTGVFTPGNFVSTTGTLVAGTDITGFTATLKLTLGGAEVFVSGVITMAPVGGLVGQGQIMLRSATSFAVATDTDTNLGLADDSGLIINGDQAVAGDTTILGTIFVDGDTSLSQDAGSNTKIGGDMFTITSSSTEIDSDTISLNGGTINLGNDDTTVQETINIATGDGADGTEYILNLGTGQDANVNIGDDTNSITTVDGALLDINATDVNLGSGAFAGTAGHVETWAEGGNLDRIPASKLPDIAIGEVHTITLTDAETTDVLGAPSEADIAADLVRDEFVFPGDEGNEINAGDVIIATGTLPGGTLGGGLTVTAMYINQTGKATGAGSTIIGADFRIISSSATTGIQSLVGGAGITTAANVITADILTGVTGNMQLLGVGAAAQIALADNVDVQGTLDVTGNATFDNLVSIPLAAAGETFIVGNGTANGAINIGAGGARTITVGNGTTVSANITAATVDLTASALGAFNVTGAGNLSVSSNDGNAIFGATGTGEFQVRGAGITAGTDIAPMILGVGADGRLQTDSISVDTRYTYFPLNVAAADVAVTAVNTVVDLTGAVPAGNMDRIVELSTFVPAVGDSVKIVNRATVATDSSLSIRLPLGHTIHGSVDRELTLDDLTVSFELYYTADATNTWLIIGAN